MEAAVEAVDEVAGIVVPVVVELQQFAGSDPPPEMLRRVVVGRESRKYNCIIVQLSEA